MSLTGNVIDIQKIQLTDTFQTWFAKTNEMVDALNPVNIYDIDDGAGTNVTYGLTGTAYNGVKYVNVNAGYGVVVGGGSGKPWTGVVGLDISSISGNAYTLTGNPAYTITGGAALDSEVNASDYFLVQDISDTAQGASGTTKRVQARYMLPREVYQPTLDFYGDLRVKGSLSVVNSAASVQVGALSINSQYVYLATTGAAGSTAGAYNSDSALIDGGVVIAMTGGIPNKEFLWKFNSANSYWTFNTPFGAKEPNLPIVASKFISRNFVSGTTANTFIFEAAGSTSTRLWLTENGVNPYFGIVKDTGSSNVNFNAYNGTGITSVAYIIAGATSQYTGVTANAFIQFANVDMVDGANATTGASAWTIPVSDQLGQLFAERHNAGQIKRRFVQANHGLTTGMAVAVIPNTYATSSLWGTLTGAQANSSYGTFEAAGIVDRVISNNEVSVTMKGYMDLSANGLMGIGANAVTGQIYYLDWVVQGGLTTNNNVPSSYLYQPVFLATSSKAGVLYGQEGTTVYPLASDTVYMRGMIPIGMIQPYAGPLGGLTMGLSGGSIPVSDVQYNQNYLPCDGRAVSATGASGFFDLFNLVGYTYPMRGTIQSSDGASNTVFVPDRGTANIGSLGLASVAGRLRAIKRTGTNNLNIPLNYNYTGGITADGTSITIIGLPTNASNLGIAGNIVDLLSPSVDNFFFLPDMRGKAPFGQYGPVGAIGEGFNLGVTGGTSVVGQTGATAVGDGGLFTNYIIRARRDSDAMVLTGHNHDSRYLRKDQSDQVLAAGSTLTLQNLEVQGAVGLAGNIGIGMQPLSWASGNTGFALTVRRDGNFGTYAAVYNSTDDANSRAGFAMNNGRTTGYLYLDRATSSTYVMATDQGASGGILISAAGNTGPVRISTNSTERMRITATGNVGIGTTNPNATLHVSGNEIIEAGNPLLSLRNTNAGADTGGILEFGHNQAGSTGPVATIRTLLTDGSASGRAGHLAISTSYGGTLSERIRVLSNGLVGIGTTTPAVALDVNGEARTSTSTTYTSNAKTLTTKDYVDSIGTKFVVTNTTNRKFFKPVPVFFSRTGGQAGITNPVLNTWTRFTLPSSTTDPNSVSYIPPNATGLILQLNVYTDCGAAGGKQLIIEHRPFGAAATDPDYIASTQFYNLTTNPEGRRIASLYVNNAGNDCYLQGNSSEATIPISFGDQTTTGVWAGQRYFWYIVRYVIAGNADNAYNRAADLATCEIVGYTI